MKSLVTPVLEPLTLPVQLAQSITKVLVRLRPEVITDVLIEHLGIDAARPLQSTLRGRPNAWHALLAAALGNGCCVITTNFDTLIESACDAMGVAYYTAVERARAYSFLFKIHGTIDALSSIALAVRQVGLGLNRQQLDLLHLFLEDRPLLVLGYSGRDDFDILPALLTTERTAPGLWIVHEPGAPIRPLRGRRSDARPALACASAWPGNLDVYSGETGEMLRRLRPPRVPPVASPPPPPSWHPEPEAAAIALMYALVEVRAFTLATRLFRRVSTTRVSSRVLIARALVLEKHGTDLREAAAIAGEARRASKHDPADQRALILDQSGVIARRRGLHGLAVRFYDRALKLALSSKCPPWLIIQIRSHRAVALEYVGRRPEALREHRRVARHEKRTGDLRGLAKTLNNIGIVLMNQHQWKPAIAAFRQSCALKHDLGDPRGTAQSLHNLGKLHFLRADYKAAEAAFLESLRLRQGRARDEHGVAQSYVALAHVAAKAGNVASAREYATRALEAQERYGDQRGITQARGLLKALGT